MPMNPTNRVLFQSVISSDPSLTGPERDALERILLGETEFSSLGAGADPESYTAVVRGTPGTGGHVIVEVYEVK